MACASHYCRQGYNPRCSYKSCLDNDGVCNLPKVIKTVNVVRGLYQLCTHQLHRHDSSNDNNVAKVLRPLKFRKQLISSSASMILPIPVLMLSLLNLPKRDACS